MLVGRGWQKASAPQRYVKNDAEPQTSNPSKSHRKSSSAFVVPPLPNNRPSRDTDELTLFETIKRLTTL